MGFRRAVDRFNPSIAKNRQDWPCDVHVALSGCCSTVDVSGFVNPSQLEISLIDFLPRK